MNKEVKELINNYAQSSKLYTNGEIKDKEAMVKALNELAEYNNKKFYFTTALIKLNRIKDGDTDYKFDEMEAKEIIDYINQLETNIDEAIRFLKISCNHDYYYKYNGKYLKSELKEQTLEILERGKE